MIKTFRKDKVVDEIEEKFFLIINHFQLNRAIVYFLLLDCVGHVGLIVNDILAPKDKFNKET